MPELTKGIDVEALEVGAVAFEFEGEGKADEVEGCDEAGGWGVEGELRKLNGLETEERFEDWDAGLAVSEYFLNAVSNPSSERYCSSSMGRGIGTLQSLSWMQEGRPVIIQSRYSREYKVYHIRTRISFSASSSSGTSLRRFKPRVWE